MTFLELTRQRASVRQFTDEMVSEEQLNYILECARMAPSAVNFQPWRFVVVESKEKQSLLHKCYSREWFNSAPLYIICVARRDQAWVRQCDGKSHSDIDIAIATEHICLAAAEVGLGSCWVCNFDAPQLSEALDMPDNEYPAVIVALGHPAAPGGEKKRKTIDEIVTRL